MQVVRHAHDLDLSRFVAQHVAYGRGAARTVALLALWQGASAAGYPLERSAGLKRSPQSCRQKD